MQYADDATQDRTGSRRAAPALAGDSAAPGPSAGMRLLSAGVPLTLLLDLGMPVDSAAIAAAEGGSAAWLTARPAAVG